MKVQPKPTLNPTGAVRFKGMDEGILLRYGRQVEGAQPAQFTGACAECDQPYLKGDWVVPDERGYLIGVNCCGGAKNETPGDPIPMGSTLDDAEDIDGRDWVPLAQVLPPGRSKADMCPKCFQIPASNGICGC